MEHTIRFRRPETAHSITKMVVQAESAAVSQIRHLERLGYTIMDVSPALVGHCALQLSGRSA
jgi:hypothetical protein